jgi:hypothetical protein
VPARLFFVLLKLNAKGRFGLNCIINKQIRSA